MIDFVRLRYIDKQKIESFVCNKDNFEKLHTVLEYYSGEINYPFTAKIGNMDVRINDRSAYVKNSIHKLYNMLHADECQNYNDFRYTALCNTIDYLDSKLIDLRKTRLTQLEFGLNIKLSLPAEDIIKQSIILHKLKIHNHNEQFNGKGEYKQFNHSNYYFKIYDKAKHYNLSEHIIRFEIKYKTSKGFNPLGIHNIHDLKSKSLLQNLFDDLLKRFDELTIVDSISAGSKITRKDTRKLESYLSYNYWEKLSERENRNIKREERKAFQSLLEKNNLLKTKAVLRASLIQKFNELLNS
ncbi:hypothetical protein HNV08_00955 [Winogradskyella eckloniae]|uniref:hypothetical protein n=1 Tax=Winogradskyella eckloniae TaxID=1089306 RepID=UPI001563658E|nr:hypothetical protein [Winogradskyella eckloniae]NRD18598.1 hypothetical protein [Winogradskyella eckloniae]